jgi:muconolactone delta-isomerase
MWNWPAEDFLLLDIGTKLGRGLKIARGPELEKGCWVEVSMSKRAAERILEREKDQRLEMNGQVERLWTSRQRAGSWGETMKANASRKTLGCHSLFTTQPPLVGMQAFVEDASVPGNSNSSATDADGDDEVDDIGDTASISADDQEEESDGAPYPIAKLSCDAGITLDFLAETTLSFLSGDASYQRHRLGEPSLRHHTDGLDAAQSQRVVFKAIVSFCAPRVASRKRGTVRTVTRFGS